MMISLEHDNKQITVAPKQAQAILNSNYRQHGIESGQIAIENYLRLNPKSEYSYELIYPVLMQVNDYLQLERVSASHLSINSNSLSANYAYAKALRFLRRPDEALLYMEKAIAINPQWENCRLELAIMYKDMGRLDEAERNLRKLVNDNCTLSNAYWHLTDINPHLAQSDIEALRNVIDNDQSPNDQVYAAFALYRFFHSNKEHQQAFEHLATGNQLQRSLFNYDLKHDIRQHQEIQSSFDGTIARGHQNGKQAIFICGMPRSGTTLVEQIISSHPLVNGGDELFELAKATEQALKQHQISAPYPTWAKELTDEQWQDIGEQYIKLTKHIAKGKRFTDKMPMNYKAVGVIANALPEAKVVYCQRSAIDIVLGCYKQLLGQGNQFAYDLTEITETVIAHNRLMRHWQQLLGEKLHIVNYEDIVKKQKQTTETLLTYLELPWQDDCLSFHNNNRPVHTMSNAQIRSPLFSSSLNAWQPYKKQLGPYMEMIAESDYQPLS